MQIEDDNQADKFWTALREQELSFFNGLEKPLWRFSVNSGAKTILPNENWLFNWGGSERWLRGDHSLAELSELAKSQQGEVQLYTGGDRSSELSLPHNETTKNLLRKVKNSFDPDNIFNPGRLYRWL